VSVQDGITFDLDTLSRTIAEEIWGDEDVYQYYREFTNAEGTVQGFTDDRFTVRPGMNINTNHLIFVFLGRTKVAVDQYGDVYIYKENDRITTFLCGYIADAKRGIIDQEETAYVEAQDHVEIPEFSPRMAI